MELRQNACSFLLENTSDALEELVRAEDGAVDVPGGRERAVYYHDTVCAAMAKLRAPVDELEMLVDKTYWPMPSYGDLMFEV